jgi:type IV secretory pathway TrbL component
MRSFVSVHFFLRLLGNYLSVDEILVNLSFTVVILLYVISSLLIALTRPYKKAYMNVTDTLILAVLGNILYCPWYWTSTVAGETSMDPLPQPSMR